MSAFRALENTTSVKLEQPLVTKLHEALVEQGDFDACEEIIREAAEGLTQPIYFLLQKQKFISQFKKKCVTNL